MKYRIRKLDDLNWVVERFEEGGGIAKRGRTAGQPKAARWINQGYFAHLKFAAQSLINLLAGDLCKDQDDITLKEILSRIEQAEKQAIEIVQAALPTPPKAG